jgi:hypothetical protein
MNNPLDRLRSDIPPHEMEELFQAIVDAGTAPPTLLKFFQELVDSGADLKTQGGYGKMAEQLLEEGLIFPLGMDPDRAPGEANS